MNREYLNVIPSINVYYSKGLEEDGLKFLLDGIEEEGIPFKLELGEVEDAVALSYEACTSSSLGVGLGMNGKQVSLHFNKLDADAPLFVININSSNDVIKALGANAARLVKGMPFKEIQT